MRSKPWRQQRGGLQAHGAGKPQVVFGHAKRLGWGDQHPTAPTHLKSNGLCGEGIGADRARGAVLFGGAQRHDHPFTALEIVLHLGPAAQLQPDLFSTGGNHDGRSAQIGSVSLGSRSGGS
jgi:hypothetical protein